MDHSNENGPTKGKQSFRSVIVKWDEHTHTFQIIAKKTEAVFHYVFHKHCLVSNLVTRSVKIQCAHLEIPLHRIEALLDNQMAKTWKSNEIRSNHSKICYEIHGNGLLELQECH